MVVIQVCVQSLQQYSTFKTYNKGRWNSYEELYISREASMLLINPPFLAAKRGLNDLNCGVLHDDSGASQRHDWVGYRHMKAAEFITKAGQHLKEML